MRRQRTISTNELVARGRQLQSSKYRVSVREMDAWLAELAEQGHLAKLGDGWRFTPKGRQHFRGVELAWGEDVAA